MEITSILDSIKTLLGINVEDTNFDAELVIHINGALMVMHQIGIGTRGFSIKDKTSTWSEFLEDRKDVELVKTTVFQKVRLIFDPPQNAFLVSAIEKQIDENIWRIELEHIPPVEEVVTEEEV